MTKNSPIIDPFAQEAEERQRKEDDRLIERIQRLARYSEPGSDIGIPWHLFEEYIAALDREGERLQRFVLTSEVWKSRRCIAAPVFQKDDRTRFVTARQIASERPIMVYPVIA